MWAKRGDMDRTKIYDHIDYSAMAAGCSCWIWTGTYDKDGYGRIVISKPRSGPAIMERTHRTSYELSKGPIPPGMCVLHSCDCPSCINPDHLRVGTTLDNARDTAIRNRRKNELIGRAKIDREYVHDIRSTYASGFVSQTTLAIRFNLGQTQVSRIIRHKSWWTV